MSTLLDAPPLVQPDWSIIRFVALPETLHECEPFMSPEDVLGHTAADEAYLAGYEVGRDGDRAHAPAGWDRPRAFAFTRGRDAGLRDKALADARELGYRMGRSDSVSEPAAGCTAGEAAAYREGFAAGLAHRADVLARWADRGFYLAALARRRYEAWLDEAFEALPPREFELCPHGVC